MFCPRCGTKLVEGSRFCYRCGCRLADYIPEPSESQPYGTEPRQTWVEQQAAPPLAGEMALPKSAPSEQEDAQLDEPQEKAPLSGPVILIDLSHKERIHEDHWSALRERLREEGRVAIRTRQPVNPALLRGKRMLVIGAPEHRWVFGRGADRWQEEEVRAIERFVARGNALWVMGDGLCNAEALSEVTAPYGITFCADPVGGVTVSGKDVYRHRLTRGVEEICLGSVRGVGGNYLRVEEPAIVLAEHNGRPVMAYGEHKGGRVLVLSSLSAFSGRHVGDQDNAILLDNILRHLLHFVPPEQTRMPSQIGPAQFEEPAEEKVPGPIDSSGSRHQAIGMPGATMAGETPTPEAPERVTHHANVVSAPRVQDDTLRFDEPGVQPAEELAAPGTGYEDDYVSELDEDETDEYDDWDDAYA